MGWGILFRREINLTYSRIQDIHLVSNIVERWLGLARIQIQTASGSAKAEMTLAGLLQFERVRDFLYSRMRGARDAGTATTPATATAAGAPAALDGAHGPGRRAHRSRGGAARRAARARSEPGPNAVSDRGILDQFEAAVATLLRLPAAGPAPPPGSTQVRLFRAAPRYLHYNLGRWGLSQAGGVPRPRHRHRLRLGASGPAPVPPDLRGDRRRRVRAADPDLVRRRLARLQPPLVPGHRSQPAHSRRRVDRPRADHELRQRAEPRDPAGPDLSTAGTGVARGAQRGRRTGQGVRRARDRASSRISTSPTFAASTTRARSAI